MRFRTVGEIVTGPGSIESIGQVVARLASRALIVCGVTSGRCSGAVERIERSLGACGVALSIFDGVEAEPSVETVDAVRARIAEWQADVVIGVGGGSVMDAAKAAAGLAGETEPASCFLRSGKEARPGVPLVTAPTTSGSGAEVTPNAVITDRRARLKQSIRNGSYLARAAVVDPQLTLSCPPRVTAHSGADALTQALEAFVSRNATPLTDALSLEAFELLWDNLPIAFEDGSNLAARTACSYGSLAAGIALSNARLGAVHGIAHPVGARCGVPHGLICAVLLPEVVRTNLPFAAAKYATISEITGADLPRRLEEMNENLGIYRDFAACRIEAAEFESIAEASMPSPSLKANPKKFEIEDVTAVLEKITGRCRSLG